MSSPQFSPAENSVHSPKNDCCDLSENLNLFSAYVPKSYDMKFLGFDPGGMMGWEKKFHCRSPYPGGVVDAE